MRSSSEVMKTKSTVRPSETQRIILDLEPAALGARRVEIGINSLLRWLDVMRCAMRATGREVSYLLSNETLQNHRPHFHRPTHNRAGRQCSTVTASCGISAAASKRTR